MEADDAGALEPDSDDAFTSGLDHARADKEVLLAKRAVAHAVRVFLEVVGFDTDGIGSLGVGGERRAERTYELFDFAVVQPAEFVAQPSFLPERVIGKHSGGELPEVLARSG